MARIAVGEALEEGFLLIRRRPLSVLAWGAVRTLLVAGTFSAMAPFYVTLFAQMANRARAGVTTPPDLSSMMQMQSLSWLLSLVGGLVGVMIYCAVFRAVLHPDQRRFAYLRLGAAELFLAVFAVGVYIALFVFILLAVIPVAVIVGISIAAHAGAVGVLVGVAAAIAALVLLFWVAFRLSMVGPMTVQDGKFHLFDAWALTRGHAGTLFLIFLCMAVILLVIEAVLGALTLALGFGVLGSAAGGLQNLPTFFSRSPVDIIASLAPALVVLGLLTIPVSGALTAIMGAPWARAYRDLAQPDVAATFA
jgi:hypothetical protein